MQEVGHGHANDIDVRILGYRLPRRIGALIPEAPRSNRAEIGTDVADGDEPQLWQSRLV